MLKITKLLQKCKSKDEKLCSLQYGSVMALWVYCGGISGKSIDLNRIGSEMNIISLLLTEDSI